MIVGGGNGAEPRPMDKPWGVDIRDQCDGA
ncbi:MAG: hypothetical protein JJT96_17755 [Opitutales bacterium]|nr:hypothetical protein [Opitutales bacterium]